MSWLRSSPLRTSFNKQRARDSPPKDADPSACYDSFCKHWQQAYDIIRYSQPPKGVPCQDDVLAVVNHVDQMVTLLLLEQRNVASPKNRNITTPTHTSCLEHLLSENLLDKLYEWSLSTGSYSDAVRLEQLKLYELLISHCGTLLAHEPVARPLLRLLEECANAIMTVEVEKRLVVLLNQLCVVLMQNMALLDLFFQTTATGNSKFIIFTLLIPHIHREGSIGQQARDAMLLCMSLSKKNDEVGLYIAEHSNVCPVLATGLSGLYSVLPRKLDIETDDWHRLTVEDVNEIPALLQLMNSLEFCNAVAQVAHPIVQKQLHEFLYQGFLVHVMGPALLQDSLGLTLEQLDAPLNWTTMEELVAATAYFDLFLRSVSEPGLLRSFITFLLEDNYDDCRILDTLIQRISSKSRLCIVTLALFETLVELNCEDIMVELCLRALSPCTHVMLSQRRRLKDIDPYGRGAEKFLSFMPNCCSVFAPVTTTTSSNSLPHVSSVLRRRNSNSASSTIETFNSLPTPMKSSESLYGNYHAYLCDAKHKIITCQIACLNWSRLYDGEESAKETDRSSDTTLADDKNLSEIDRETFRPPSFLDDVIKVSRDNVLENIKSLLESNNCPEENGEKSETIPLSPEEQAKLDADIAELLNEDFGISEPSGESLLADKKETSYCVTDENNTAMNSLLSLGESSGYESFAFKGSAESTPDNEPYEGRISENEEADVDRHKEPSVRLHGVDEPSVTKNAERTVSRKSSNDIHNFTFYPPELLNGKANVGVFLDVLLRKLECMMTNNVYVNLHLTGLISRLAIYPQPILQSFLLNHSLVFQPTIKSLFQVLAALKNKIDQYLTKQEGVEELVEQAKMFLISREDKLVNARKSYTETCNQSVQSIKRNSLSSEPFTRGEPKRRSLTTSISQMFKRPTTNSGPNSFSGSVSQPSSISENQPTLVGDGSGYRYYVRSSWESSNELSQVQNVVLCAIILGEWLKELAAITQEHAILSLSSNPVS